MQKHSQSYLCKSISKIFLIKFYYAYTSLTSHTIKAGLNNLFATTVAISHNPYNKGKSNIYFYLKIKVIKILNIDNIILRYCFFLN
jgi:hypothetical protein